MQLVNRASVLGIPRICFLGRARLGALTTALACLALVGTAKAAPFTGGFGFFPALVNSGGTASYGSSSLTLNNFEAVSSNTGSFANELLATVTASTTPITGLTAVPTPVNVPNFLLFALPSQDGPSPPYGAGNGNEYAFNLQTLSESPDGFGNFLGSGILVDQSNVLDTTPAIITIGFSSANNFAGTVTALVPEPATLGLLATGLLSTLSIRRRRSAR